MTLHRCTDSGCSFVGQQTTKGCGCHKTDEQVLREQRDALLEALEASHKALKMYEWYDNPASGWALPENEHVRGKVEAAFAKAKEAA